MLNPKIYPAWIASGFILAWLGHAIAAEPVLVKKEVCLSSFGMQWKTSEEGKAHLLSVAKREAMGELFGEMIKSSTRIEDFQLKRDEIEILGAGILRIQGNPEYFNGPGFGEMCIRIAAYVAEEDRERFRPRSVRKKVCFGDQNLSAESVKKEAERRARIQAVTDIEPQLEKNSDDTVLALLHEAKIEEGGFLPGSSTYCATASGKVLPIELAITSRKNLKTSEADVRSSSGNIAEAENYFIELKGCRISTGKLTCDLLITNRASEDRKVFLYGSGKVGFDDERAEAIDDEGKRYPLSEIRLGDKTATGAPFLEINQGLPRDVPVAVNLVFATSSGTIKKVVLLKFYIGSDALGDRVEVQFRDIVTGK
jgi:hypothetical protein